MPPICPQCQQPFEPHRYNPTQKYCTQDCRRKAMSARNASDPEAQRRRGKLGGAVRGQQLKEAAGSGWYLKEDGLHVHRVVAAAVLGRDLEPDEIVHHEDLNKQNNHPSNLIVFPSQADHARHHKLKHCGKPCSCPGIRLKEVMPNETS